MINMKPSNGTRQLKENHDPDFEMEQLLTQPIDGAYPPILYTYDWKLVYDLVDKNENVDEYIDYRAIKAMNQTLDNFPKDCELKGNPLAYKQILEKWG